MDRPRIELTREELERAEIPLNHVLVEMVHTSEGIKSKGGVVMGFLTDDTFAEGDDSHPANLAECYARVYKVPKALYFNPDDPLSMDWDVDMELQGGDMVWFSTMESKNSPEVMCEKTLYKSIPYFDCYCYKRTINGVPPDIGRVGSKFTIRQALGGYVLCEILYKPKLSSLDVLSEDMVDKTKGRVKFVGTPPRAYLRESYCHIDDIRVGDEVLFDNPAVVFLLERTVALANFDGDNLYWVVPRRRISLILNR